MNNIQEKIVIAVESPRGKRNKWRPSNKPLYTLGRLCQNSHNYKNTGKSLRNYNDSHCVKCHKVYMKKYNKQYREANSKYFKDYSKADRIKYKEYFKEYRINRRVNRDNS